ncbi:hypothetical protein NUW54_g1320 [Trametes sanguinea]|uniref:Uncharacterized protein n=1 Tax=Trametes sanguinea TaxID=158606 RepID=A0ACC1Q6P1_9APHY|nr:hypothetical protein NUW54_g1320 [Trametes sanguinea]
MVDDASLGSLGPWLYRPGMSGILGSLSTVMPVTEIATLRLNSPHIWDSPASQSFFADVAAQQAAWSGYLLHYFQDTSDPLVIYILTGWESVSAHFDWIKSEQNQKLLERGEGLMEVVGLQHVNLGVELKNAQFVVLEQWQRGTEEDVGEEREEVGSVEEAPEQVCRIKGFAREEDVEGQDEQEDVGKKRAFMRRFSVPRS